MNKLLATFNSIAIDQGPDQSFTIAYSDLKDYCFDICFKMTRSKQASEDISQDVFLRIWSQKEQISTVKNVKAFIAVSAHNASIDYLRKQKKGYEFFQTYAKAHRSYFDPNEYFDQKETERFLRLAIQSLSPQRKTVFILGWVEGSTRDQIAKRLGISPNTVKNLMQQARRDVQDFFIQHTGMKRLNALKIMKFVWQSGKVSKVA